MKLKANLHSFGNELLHLLLRNLRDSFPNHVRAEMFAISKTRSKIENSAYQSGLNGWNGETFIMVTSSSVTVHEQGGIYLPTFINS